jgi:apolipoprotein N-acyltransferase
MSELSATAVKRIQVGVVQGNVSRSIKSRWRDGDAEAAKQALKVYLASSQELLDAEPRPDLVIWPETAYPGIFRRPENEEQAHINAVFDRFLAQSETPFVFGAYDREDRIDRRVLRNAIFFVEPKSGQSLRELSPMQVYHKHILLPVGEYLPFTEESWIRKWLPKAGALSKGDGPRSYDLTTANRERVRIGASICYEDLFSAHSIGLARRGAEVIVNLSDDSWFGDYGLPQYHVIAAKLRSIETRLPHVSVTSTGYSALVLPSGDVVERSEYGVRASMSWSVPVVERRETLMVRWGDWFGAASLFLSGTGLLMVARVSRTQ